MNIEDLEEKFQNNGKEFHNFKAITNKKSMRPDLHAFILLDLILSGNEDIIGSAEHDQIWLNYDLEKLSERITESQIIELIRCGIFLDEDALSMFV